MLKTRIQNEQIRPQLLWLRSYIIRLVMSSMPFKGLISLATVHMKCRRIARGGATYSLLLTAVKIIAIKVTRALSQEGFKHLPTLMFHLIRSHWCWPRMSRCNYRGFSAVGLVQRVPCEKWRKASECLLLVTSSRVHLCSQ